MLASVPSCFLRAHVRADRAPKNRTDRGQNGRWHRCAPPNQGRPHRRCSVSRLGPPKPGRLALTVVTKLRRYRVLAEGPGYPFGCPARLTARSGARPTPTGVCVLIGPLGRLCPRIAPSPHRPMECGSTLMSRCVAVGPSVEMARPARENGASERWNCIVVAQMCLTV